MWLPICGNSAAFFTRLQLQVFDILEWLEDQMKFEPGTHPIFLNCVS